MKIIHGGDITNNINLPHESINYVRNEVNNGSMKYVAAWDSLTGLNPIFTKMDSLWQKILVLLNYDLNGKKILELGCGSNDWTVESITCGNNYEPWFGRFMHATKEKTGIEYIGIDIGNLSKEQFNHMQMNLLDKNCLINNFSKNEFNIIIAYSIFNSPELEKNVTGVTSKMDASYKTSELLRDNLLPQLETILKPDGILLWNGGDRRLFNDYILQKEMLVNNN